MLLSCMPSSLLSSFFQFHCGGHLPEYKFPPAGRDATQPLPCYHDITPTRGLKIGGALHVQYRVLATSLSVIYLIVGMTTLGWL